MNHLHKFFAKQPESDCLEEKSHSYFASDVNTPEQPSSDSSDKSSSLQSAQNKPIASRSKIRTLGDLGDSDILEQTTEIIIPKGTLFTGNKEVYTIGRKLPGMTGNYRAESNGKHYVIKTGLDCRKRTAKRVTEREIRALLLLQPEGIMPTLHDTGEAYSRIFLVLRYIDGEDLSSIIDRIGSFPNTSSTDYLNPLLTAVSKFHGKGLVHRDIKPSNVRYGKKNEQLDTEKPFLLDGGLSLPENEAKHGDSCGSPIYASPEQTIDGYSDFRSDVYSLGATLCEMLIGRKRFSQIRESQLAAQLVSALNPSHYGSDVNTHLSQIVMTATQPDLRHRYQNTNEMLEDLKIEDSIEHAETNKRE